MLKLVRRLGLGSPDAPSIPGMQVVDWRIVELQNKKAIIALCYKDSILYLTLHRDDSPPNTSQLTASSTVAELENSLRLDSVDPADIYPEYTAQFALYVDKEGKPKKDVFVKRTSIMDLVAAHGTSAIHSPRSAKITAHEASICERLGVCPHPNIVEYLGVQVRDSLSFLYQRGIIDVPLARNSVVGLVFSKYDCTLHELVVRRREVDARSCLLVIAAGLKHLHAMGIVHGDVKPDNVFVRRGDRDQFVLGDFDCSRTTGSLIMLKTGDSRWGKRKKIGVDVAQEDDDWYAFGKLTEWLVGEVGGRLEDYTAIRKAV